MDARGTLTLIVVIAAIVVAVMLLLKYGLVSWSFWLGAPAVALVAWILLWVINFSMPHLEAQAGGVVDQAQNLANKAAPALIAPASGDPGVVIEPQSSGHGAQTYSNPSQGGNQTGQGQQVQGQEPLIQAPLPTPVPLQPGDTVWLGTANPQPNDPFMFVQYQCYGSEAKTWESLILGKKVPYGVTVSTETAWGLLPKQFESWKITLKFPSDKIGDIVIDDVSGNDGHQLRNAMGADTIVGQAPWPLVRGRITASGASELDPNFACKFQ